MHRCAGAVLGRTYLKRAFVLDSHTLKVFFMQSYLLLTIFNINITLTCQ